MGYDQPMLDWDASPQETIHGETWIVLHVIISAVLLPIKALLALFRVVLWKDVVAPFLRFGQMLLETKATIRLCALLVGSFVLQLVLPQSVTSLFVMRSSDIVSGTFHTVLTASFLHAGVLHLAGNVAGVLVFGRVVERYFGEMGVYVTYFFGVLVGGAATQLVRFAQGSAWSAVGASIGVSALIGIAVLRKPFYVTYVTPIPGPIALIGALYVWQESSNLFVADGVSHLGHVFGVLTAVILAFVTGGFAKTWTRIGLVILAAVFSFFVLAVASSVFGVV